MSIRAYTFFVLVLSLYICVHAHFDNQAISYTDLINKKSALWERFKHKTPQEIAALFVAKSALQSDFIISDVPGLQHDSKTAVHVYLKASGVSVENALQVQVTDMNNNSCIEGHLSPTNKSAYLALLRATPQPGSGVLGLGEQKRLISGTTAVLLWDKFWELWGINRGFLTDAAVYEGFYLRVLLPYVYGHSWYGKFGYFPHGVTREQYAQAVNFLIQRTLQQITDDCVECPHVSDALNQGLACTGLTMSDTIGSLVRTLYLQWRYGRVDIQKPLLAPAERLLRKEALKMVYDACLFTYPVSNESVSAALAVVSWNSSLEKSLLNC